MSNFFDPTSVCPEDFTFIVDKQKYYCHKMVLMYLSNTLSQQISADPTFSLMEIQGIKDPNHYFQILIDYFHGKQLKLTDQNYPLIASMIQYLQISSLFQEISNYIYILTKENAIQISKNYSENGLLNPECAKLIALSWNEFIKKEEIYSLPVLSFDQIFKCDEFSVDDESELFNFIIELIKRNSNEYASLFQYCYGDKLGPQDI